ncbi:hypothetical protein EHRUM3_07820 [Ehrlichia ruminantium]|uniref:DUF3023 domain-containing protein n=1 Tax=Ehrlichia ruminantium TaxID=779 RepID=A0A170T355_EHRRU|nr:DUF3023 domain-containing protein [Ehrlichia ruminantium]GAT78556.1 hypothetical protein EHRUM3_07820 [Ehrlichia ruminantium]
MLFKKNKLFSSALHGQVLVELNNIDRLYVKSICCIGNTDANGNFNVIINRDKTYHLCTPGQGKSLFHMQCTVSTKRLKKYPSLNELFYKLYPNFLPLAILNIEAYFLVEHTNIDMVNDIINNPEGPVNGTTVFKKYKPVLNPGTFGKFILCNPISVGNLDTFYNTEFNEHRALQTLGNLKDATFQTAQESPKSDTTTQKAKQQSLFSRFSNIFHKKTPLEKDVSEESQGLLEEGYEELGAVGGIGISTPIYTPPQQLLHKDASEEFQGLLEEEYEELGAASSIGTNKDHTKDPEPDPLAIIHGMSVIHHKHIQKKH